MHKTVNLYANISGVLAVKCLRVCIKVQYKNEGYNEY